MPVMTTAREPGHPPTAAQPRVRWEYHTEVLKADLIADRLEDLGDAGWELVQVFAYAPTHRELWLKRRR